MGHCRKDNHFTKGVKDIPDMSPVIFCADYENSPFPPKRVALDLKVLCMIEKGDGGTFCCRSLTTYKRKYARLSTAARIAVYLDR